MTECHNTLTHNTVTDSEISKIKQKKSFWDIFLQSPDLHPTWRNPSSSNTVDGRMNIPMVTISMSPWQRNYPELPI